MGRCSTSSTDSHGPEEKLSEDAAISHPKFMVPGKTDGKMSNRCEIFYFLNNPCNSLFLTIFSGLSAYFSLLTNLSCNEFKI